MAFRPFMSMSLIFDIQNVVDNSEAATVQEGHYHVAMEERTRNQEGLVEKMQGLIEEFQMVCPWRQLIGM